jgi:mannose-6-phosphate isomerase-like protein (cupin superfamily)
MPTPDSGALPAARHRAAADVPTLTVARLGVAIRTLVATPDAGGALAALDYTAPPAFRGPAPHWHARITETFVGVEGTPVLRAGDAEHVLDAGAVVVVPPRVVHAFSNPGDRPARFLVLATPGAGLEGYFTELARLVGDAPTWPPSDPSVLAALTALAERYDTFSPPVA